MSVSFSLPTESYKRDIDPLGQYLHQAATYLSIQTGDSYEQCRDWVRTSLETKQFKDVKDPTITYYEKNEFGDRSEQKTKLSDYIYSTIRNKDIMAPTLTTYVNPKVRKSLLVDFIEYNIKERSIAKKAGFKARESGDLFTYEIKNSEQNNAKIANNSISGAHAQVHNPLYCKSTHSTLTTITRVASSSGNINNERLLMGNRSYYSYDIVVNNITSIVSETDYNELDRVVEKYNLHYPTPQEMLSVITYSSRHYWLNPRLERTLLEYITKLSPLQRAAFVYTGDLYHLRKFNDSFIKQFLVELSEVVDIKPLFALKYIRSVDEEVLNLAHLLCSHLIKGMGKEYEQMEEKGVLDTLYSTCLNIELVLARYADFIKIILLTRNVPNSISSMKTMYRKCAIISDTDSTIFTTQDWNKWFNNGVYDFNDPAERISHCLTYISTASLSHNLALASANMGMEDKRIRTMQMKSEFYFPVMVPASGSLGPITKHYFAIIAAQEGNIKDEYEFEVKGVHLKNSAVSKALISDAQGMIKDILRTVRNNDKLSILSYLKRVADKEREVINLIKSGEVSYFKRTKVKNAGAYSDVEDKSPYSRHKFWIEVFEPKYGKIDPPPYSVVKLPTKLLNKRDLEFWLESIRDSELSSRLRVWLERNGKRELPTMYLNGEYARSRGIPDEIFSIIDYRKIIRDIFNAHYIVLGSLGYYKGIESIISDTY